MASSTTHLDLISLGEVLVEFSHTGQSIWRSAWAGDAVNTLFYASRLGLKTGLITRFGSDPFTEMMVNGIENEGIDLSLSEIDKDRPNGLYFIELDEGGEYTFHFRRNDSAARRCLEMIDHDRFLHYVGQSSWFLFSGITLAVMSRDGQLLRLLERLRSATTTKIAFDTNYRAALWESFDSYRALVEEILPHIDLFLPSLSDLRQVWTESSLEELFTRFNLEHVALKCGGEGAQLWQAGEHFTLSVDPTCPVADTTGAGDGFNAGYLAGLIRGFSPEERVKLGLKVAERVVGVRGAIDLNF